jgi:hypothetical protein
MVKILSEAEAVVMLAGIEVIGPGAFRESPRITEIVFESVTRLREIGEAAFAECRALKTFHVPSSVETIGDRCFENSRNMITITFEGRSLHLPEIFHSHPLKK